MLGNKRPAGGAGKLRHTQGELQVPNGRKRQWNELNPFSRTEPATPYSTVQSNGDGDYLTDHTSAAHERNQVVLGARPNLSEYFNEHTDTRGKEDKRRQSIGVVSKLRTI